MASRRKGGPERRTAKSKRRFKRSELAGFAAIILFTMLVLYLAFSPPSGGPTLTTSPRGTASSMGASTETRAGRAAIVDQLGLRMPNPSFLGEAEDILRRAGFQVDVYPHDKVTVNLYREISAKGYSLIVFRVHMGVNDEAEDKPVGMFTAEPYNQFEYALEQLRDQVASAKAYNTTEILFAVSPKFIREATVLDYPGTVIILSGCFGLYSRPLPEAFTARGASTVIGWSGLVSSDHTDAAVVSLLKALCLERLSVEDAVAEVMREVGPDPENGSRLGYYPPNMGGYKLPSTELQAAIRDISPRIISRLYTDMRGPKTPNTKNGCASEKAEPNSIYRGSATILNETRFI
ncbi:MAG: hypothetical protein ACP5K1_07130 [Candidatus Bathyarchaeia archaeon]